MYSKVNTCVLQGLNARIINVESDLSSGLPQFNIVGLADTAIKESKERVRTAVKNSDIEFPIKRITINLAPANEKKEGSQMDLAIAVGILLANGDIDNQDTSDMVIIGELALDGTVNSVQGALPMLISMRDLNVKKCIVPDANKKECAIVEDIEIIPVKNLREVVDYLNGQIAIEPYKNKEEEIINTVDDSVDFSDMKGQEG